MQFKAKWGRKTLHWFWSDVYWYVTLEQREYRKGRPISDHRITGCGATKDEAFIEYRKLTNL